MTSQRQELFNERLELYRGGNLPIYISQSLYRENGHVYLETSLDEEDGKFGNAKKIKDTRDDAAMVKACRQGWEEMKEEVDSIKRTVAGYIYNKTGAVCKNVGSNAEFPQGSYSRLVSFVLGEYITDWGKEFEAGDVGPVAYPLYSSGRVYHHIRKAIKEGIADLGEQNPKLGLDSIERRIMACDKTMESYLLELHKFAASKAEFFPAYESVGGAMAQSIENLNNIWADTLTEVRKGTKTDMKLINERCDRLMDDIDSVRQAYKGFKETGGVMLQRHDQKYLDEFDAVEVLLEQMEEIADLMRTPYRYKEQIAAGMKATSRGGRS